MPINRNEIINTQSQFYKLSFRRLVNFALGLGVLLLLLIGIVMYQYITRPEVKYFVTTSDGRLIEVPAIER